MQRIDDHKRVDTARAVGRAAIRQKDERHTEALLAKDRDWSAHIFDPKCVECQCMGKLMQCPMHPRHPKRPGVAAPVVAEKGTPSAPLDAPRCPLPRLRARPQGVPREQGLARLWGEIFTYGQNHTDGN
jgi:hypothetical protein